MICDTAPKLRDYQVDDADAIREAFSANRSVLAVHPTGLGKTVLFCSIAAQWLMGRIIIVENRDALVWQTAKTWEWVTGDAPDIEMGEYHSAERRIMSRRQCVVATVQSLSRPGRLGRFDPSQYGLLIFDEAHHSTSRSYREIFNYFTRNPGLKVLGVTATPKRADEKALGTIFDSVAVNRSIAWAIDNGWLVPIDQKFIRADKIDLSAVRSMAGDLNEQELEQVMVAREPLCQVVVPTIECAGDRPTLVFAVSVAHAKYLADTFNDYEPGSAAWLAGESTSEQRGQVLADFRAGRIKRLCNCALYTEGADLPHVACVAMARPTTSTPLYTQMLGRGTRPLPGLVDCGDWYLGPDERRERIALSDKSGVLILDFVGNAGDHKLISAVDVLDGDYEEEVIARAKQNLQGGGSDEEKDIQQALREADEQLRRDRVRNITPTVEWTAREVNPFDALGVTPTREPGWERGKLATKKQMDLIREAGYTPPENLSRHNASALCDEITRRKRLGAPSAKQASFLSRQGYSPGEIAKMTFKEAQSIIGQRMGRWNKQRA